MENSLKNFFKNKSIKTEKLNKIPNSLKFGHWNINGLNSQMKKDTFFDYLKKKQYDFFLFNEIKIDKEKFHKLDKFFNFIHEEKYKVYANHADKKGYSGVMILYKHTPLRIYKNFEFLKNGKVEDLFPSDKEGRIITFEYENFFLVSTYVPNSKGKLERLDYRTEKWDVNFRGYLNELKKIKNVILGGDLNVAHKEIDLKNPKTNLRTPGFTIEERNSFDKLLDSGFKDSFRQLYPEKVQYTFWSNFRNSRQKNVGWRLDYFLVNDLKYVKDSTILDKVLGSDHCPIELIVNFDK